MCVLDGDDPIRALLSDGGILLGVYDKEIAQRVVDQIETHIGGDLLSLTIVLNKGIEKSSGIESISEPETKKIDLERSPEQSDIIASKVEFGAEMTTGPKLSPHLKAPLFAIPKVPVIEPQASRENTTAVGVKLEPVFVIVVITERNPDTGSNVEVLIQPLKEIAPSQAQKGTVLEKEVHAKAVFAREEPIVLISKIAHVDDGLNLPNHLAFPGTDARVNFNTLDTNAMTYRKAEVISIILLDVGVGPTQLEPR